MCLLLTDVTVCWNKVFWHNFKLYFAQRTLSSVRSLAHGGYIISTVSVWARDLSARICLITVRLSVRVKRRISLVILPCLDRYTDPPGRPSGWQWVSGTSGYLVIELLTVGSWEKYLHARNINHSQISDSVIVHLNNISLEDVCY